MSENINPDECTPLGIKAYTNDELAKELMSRCKRGVVLMRFDNEEGALRFSLFQGGLDEVVGMVENEVFYQKYADARERFEND